MREEDVNDALKRLTQGKILVERAHLEKVRDELRLGAHEAEDGKYLLAWDYADDALHMLEEILGDTQ